MPRLHIIYHNPCLDGFGSAFAAFLKYGEDAVYLPGSYQQAPPRIERGAEVVMADVSYDRDTLVRMRQRASRLIILDHHESALNDLEPHRAEIADEVVFDLGHSGCVLMYQHLNPGEEVPEFFRRIEDEDLWRWKMDRNEAFIAGLSALPLTFDVWKAAYERGVNYLIEQGEAILTYRARLVESIIETGVFSAEFAGPAGYVRVPAVAGPRILRNEIAQELMDRYPEAPFAALMIDMPDGRRSWSLRSRPDRMNVMEVASLNGGGGHRGAAAFVEGHPGEKVRVSGAYESPTANRKLGPSR